MTTTARALDIAILASRTALPLETGGILLGYRTLEGVHVSEFLEVYRRRQLGTFTRHQGEAQRALEAARQRHPEYVGFVGDWHSHAGPPEPSRQDRRVLRRVARQFRNVVALVVIGFDEHGTPTATATIGRRGRTLRSVLIAGPEDERSG